MDKFAGKWEVVSTDKCDDFFKEAGYDEEFVKQARVFHKPGVISEYRVSGNKITELIYMTADSEPFGQTSELNKEQESTDGGRTSKMTVSLGGDKGDKLITDQYFPDEDIHAKYVQEIVEEDGKKYLISELTCKDVTAKLKLIRV